MNDLVVIDVKKPEIPATWSYEKSVSKVKTFIYKWKNLDEEIFSELWVAREKLRNQGLRRDLTSGQMSRSWEDYCTAIGTEKRTVNRWLEQRYSEKKEEIKEIRNRIIEAEPVEGKYDVVILDPPWAYGREYDPQGSRVASPYPEQTKDEIYKTCERFFKDDCVLWLWTTHQFIWEAKELIDAWGFEYKATMVWDKESMGMGAWLRMQCEFCLLAVKGDPIFHNTSVRDIIRSKRREHSRKPEEFYEIVKKVSDGASIFEYYSREHKEGIITSGIEDGKLGRKNNG